MILAWCVASTMCAAALCLLLMTHPASMKTMRGARLWWSSVLLLPGQVLPPVLLWLSWSRTYYVIPFLGPPVRVGMLPVWWAIAAVLFSYLPAMGYAVQQRWRWYWIVLHPCGTIRMLWHGWQSRSTKHAG